MNNNLGGNNINQCNNNLNNMNVNNQQVSNNGVVNNNLNFNNGQMNNVQLNNGIVTNQQISSVQNNNVQSNVQGSNSLNNMNNQQISNNSFNNIVTNQQVNNNVQGNYEKVNSDFRTNDIHMDSLEKSILEENSGSKNKFLDKMMADKKFVVAVLVIILLMGTIVVLLNRGDANYYVVIFDSNGGSSVGAQSVREGNNIIKPKDPIYDGNEFLGWYYNDKKYNFKNEVDEDITLEAKWKKIEEEKEEEEDKKEEIKEETKKEESKKEETPKKEETKPVTNNQTNNSKPNEVKPKPAPSKINVSSISLSRNSLDLKVGESQTISAVVTPSNATNKTVTWRSSNNGVATVSNGVIRAVGAGSATITATADGKSVNCVVRVTKVITYSYELVDAANSTTGQCYLYIKSSEGRRVSGSVRITYTNGASEYVDVTEQGILLPSKSAIMSVSDIKVN